MKYLLIVENNKVEADEKWKDFTLKLVSKAMRKKGNTFIYAVQKDNVIEFTSLLFNEEQGLKEAIKEFEDLGLTVYFEV